MKIRFKAACAAGLVLVAWNLPAADVMRVVAKAGRATCRYACGEPAEVTFDVLGTNGVRLTAGEVTVSADNFGARQVVAPRTVDLVRENPFKVKATNGEPGFVRFTVSGKGLSRPFVYGVGFDVPRIRPGTPDPADFDAFWSEAIARYDREFPSGPAIRLDEKLSRGMRPISAA